METAVPHPLAIITAQGRRLCPEGAEDREGKGRSHVHTGTPRAASSLAGLHAAPGPGACPAVPAPPCLTSAQEEQKRPVRRPS